MILNDHFNTHNKCNVHKIKFTLEVWNNLTQSVIKQVVIVLPSCLHFRLHTKLQVRSSSTPTTCLQTARSSSRPSSTHRQWVKYVCLGNDPTTPLHVNDTCKSHHSFSWSTFWAGYWFLTAALMMCIWIPASLQEQVDWGYCQGLWPKEWCHFNHCCQERKTHDQQCEFDVDLCLVSS